MKPHEVKTFYKRNLPHIQPVGEVFFVTFRLQGSIPRIKLLELKREYEARVLQIEDQGDNAKNMIYQERQRFFEQYDALLDQVIAGPTYLKQAQIAQLVADELHRFDNDLFQLIAYTIMPNHVHILIDTSIQLPDDLDIFAWETLDITPLSGIMKRIKGPSAVNANRLLGRSGKFWQRESYDHYIRNEKELNNVIGYILGNPVKVGLVEDWEAHTYTWVAESAK